jgi:hypothetical protein
MSGATAEARHHQAFEGANEAALLITSLRDLPIIVPPEIDWQVLRRLAEENGVLALTHKSLVEAGAVIPDFFTAAALESRGFAEKLASELEGLLQSLAERGIEVLPLKGPAMALALYGDVTSRSCKDLDLLVRRANYRDAERLLVDLGFVPKRRDQYHGKFVRNELLVELHLDIVSPSYFPFDTENVWNRSHPDCFRGQPTRVMCDEDIILYLCLHGLKHRFSRLIWILDLARALNSSVAVDYEALRNRAKQEGIEPWLLIGCEIVRITLGNQLPGALDALIAESPKKAKRASLIATSLFTEPDQNFRRFYLELESSARQRWRCRLGYLVPTPLDYEWAKRHGISRGLTPVLRPFRALAKYGPRRAWGVVFPPK